MQLDHVVHAVHDRERAADALCARGLHVVTGGEHPNWGTLNALAYFEDLSYIELIAVQDPVVAAASDFGAPILRFLEQGEGAPSVTWGRAPPGCGTATALRWTRPVTSPPWPPAASAATAASPSAPPPVPVRSGSGWSGAGRGR